MAPRWRIKSLAMARSTGGLLDINMHMDKLALRAARRTPELARVQCGWVTPSNADTPAHVRCRSTARTIDRGLIGAGWAGGCWLTCRNANPIVGSRWSFADELRTICGLDDLLLATRKGGTTTSRPRCHPEFCVSPCGSLPTLAFVMTAASFRWRRYPASSHCPHMS